MKPFEELTHLGQLRRLRKMAQAALIQYGLDDARLTFINHGENTTFRVDIPGSVSERERDDRYVANRYLLRIHRPGYQTVESIASELAWLSALRSETSLAVPDPVFTGTGESLTWVGIPGIPESRVCCLFRWMRGRLIRQQYRPHHFEALGQLAGQLHNHTTNWSLSEGFVRRSWDWQGLFGEAAGFCRPAADVWALLPESYIEILEEVAVRTKQVMRELGTDIDAFGLIHADLFAGGYGNVLLAGREVRPIDFDDCGFGYWIYDLAVSLADWQQDESWPTFRDAMLEGYSSVRSLPDKQLAHLDLFMAARHVSVMLWGADMAQVNPGMRNELSGWLEWSAAHVRSFLEHS